jgi:Flp pilus assembly protein TadD
MKSLWVLLVLATVACSSTSRNLTNLSPEAWDFEVRSRGVDPREAPNPLTITEPMRSEALRIAGHGGILERLKQLQVSLFDSDTFPFSYASRVTLTAAEAFHRREGNCLSFTNLFVAMSRSMGVPVTTALVLRSRGSEKEGDLIVVNNHVIAVFAYGGGTEYYDFDRTREQRPAAIKVLDDMWITALYLNNRGADELRAGHPDVAVRHFRNAVKLAPEFAPAWGNLGVALRRVNDVPAAFQAYERALAIEPDNPTVLTNLAGLYRSTGREPEAQIALKAGRVSGASPHVLLMRGDLELAQGRPEKALEFYRRARRLNSLLPDAWIAMAKAKHALGKDSTAVRYLNRALELDPNAADARVLLDRISDDRGDGPRPAQLPD